MQKATAAIFDAAVQRFELVDLPVPEPVGSEIRVRNTYVTLCGSDLKTYTGERKEKNPTILGHEVCGHIDAFGPTACRQDASGRPLNRGDFVTWSVFASAADDPQSLAGRPQKAASLFKYGHEQHRADCSWHGGLAAYTILRAGSTVLKVKKSIPASVVALVNCALATATGALRLAGSLRGQRVLIAGAGALGLMSCAVSKDAGAAHVAVVEPDAARRDFAGQFGVKETFSPEEATGRFDLILETSGAPSAMERALEMLAIGGRCVWLGAVFPQRKVQVSAEALIRGVNTIRGLHNYNRTDFIKALNFMERNYDRFPFDCIIQHEFPLAEVNSAFEYAITAKPLRVGVRITSMLGL